MPSAIWTLRRSRSSSRLLRLRKLVTADLFKAVRVIKTSGLREEVKPMLQKAADGKADVQNVGIEAIMTVIGALAESGAERAMYEFLSGPFEMDPGEVASLDLMDLVDKANWLWKEGNLQDFFGQLSSLITSK